jgi:hypothetical protein
MVLRFAGLTSAALTLFGRVASRRRTEMPFFARAQPSALFVVSLLSACTAAAPEATPTTPRAAGSSPAPAPAALPPSASSEAARPPARLAPPQLEPDGNDEVAEAGIALPEHAHFEKVGRHWAALQRVCDFAVLDGALYMAHATKPLGLGGASITRFTAGATPPFSLAFNWNREGEPERGGAGGQGFLRLRLLDGRLYAPDADPPYLGLGLATGIEGYLFASDHHGRFAAARKPGHLPPRQPTQERAGAHVLPGVLHGFDVIRFRGKLYASSSAAIPPNGNASSSPGTLLTPGAEPGPWQVAFTYAGAAGEDSVRLGYMTRFRDKLYVAISPLYGLDRHDFVVIAPPRDATTFSSADARAVKATPAGGTHTLRWFPDRGRLYWITIGRGGRALRVSEDGERFRELALPPEAGAPSDLLRSGELLLLLAEHGLYELSGETFRLRARISEPKTPFQADDGYCAAPLAIYRGSLFAGDQQRGNLWQLVAD